MDVEQMIRAQLKTMGADRLMLIEEEGCGCTMDDLMPCDDLIRECKTQAEHTPGPWFVCDKLRAIKRALDQWIYATEKTPKAVAFTNEEVVLMLKSIRTGEDYGACLDRHVRGCCAAQAAISKAEGREL